MKTLLLVSYFQKKFRRGRGGGAAPSPRSRGLRPPPRRVLRTKKTGKKSASENTMWGKKSTSWYYIYPWYIH